MGETSFLAIDGEDLTGTSLPGCASHEQTLVIGNVANDHIVQARRPRTLAPSVMRT